ncbi:MAG: hypothetical protein P1P88_24565, partial [Bacteroidales bacterium]|nr:hypothetical protein [Bacteroidales bacterium]
NNLYIPEFEKWEIQRIDFHSMVMIDVYVKFESKGVFYLNRVRMIAEKKPYVTHPEAKFRYNPNSLRLVPAQPMQKH